MTDPTPDELREIADALAVMVGRGGAAPTRWAADEIERLYATLDLIGEEACEAQMAWFANGGIESTDPDCLAEAQRFARALHRIGHLVHPDRWTTPDEPLLWEDQ